MPWTIKDVDKHKKGLSDKQKKQWVRIANSVLKRCMEKGGSEEECAASAIRQANGVVGNCFSDNYIIHKSGKQDAYEITYKKHQDKAYLVVPVVMMVEGVHHGSHGPMLHKINELGKFPESWNGIPVVINHPEEDGICVSANSPDIIDSITVGRVYNTNVDGDKLRAEAWIDEEKMSEVAPQLLEGIYDGEILEVSVGVYTDEEEVVGEWNGEKYERIAKNHRPDHLAILSGYVGACSVEDGCGLGVNKEFVLNKSILRWNKRGYKISSIVNNVDEKGFKERLDAAYNALRAKEKDGEYYYLEEMYNDNLIYSKNTKEGTTLYRQYYKFEGGKIELIDTPVVVVRKVEYILTNKKGGKIMANECSPCIKKKVDDLIANSEGRWTEDDRVFLEGLNELQLDKLTPQIIEKVVEKEVQVNVLSDEDRAALAAYKKEQKIRRDRMISEIQANTSKEQWPDDVLNSMNNELLERIHSSVVKREDVVDYTLHGVRPIHVNSDMEPLYPVGVEIKK